MVKYLKRLGLIRLTELFAGMLCIAVACLIVTGADIFESGSHINLASLDKTAIRNDMYVELDVVELLDIYGQDAESKGSYYIMPYPVTKESKDGKIALMAVFIPNDKKEQADAILYDTASAADEKTQSIHMNGRIVSMPSTDKKLFKSGVEKVVEDYNLENSEELYYIFFPTNISVFDYIATGFLILVVGVYILALIFILSGKNEELVSKFVSENKIDKDKFIKEMDEAKTYGKVIVSDNYIAYMNKLKIHVIKRADIVVFSQLEVANDEVKGSDSIKEDTVVIRLKDNVEHRVSMRHNYLVKLLDYMQNNH